IRRALFLQNSFHDINVYFDASQLAVDNDGRVIGFIIAKKWQDSLDVNMLTTTSWIQTLVVDEKYKGHQIGSLILRHTVTSLKNQGMEQVLLGRDTQHYLPGIPRPNDWTRKWFETKGHEKQDTEYDVFNSYDDTSQIVEPMKDGVEFGVLRENEKEPFLNFLRRCFPGRWEYEAIKYFEKNGTGREF